MPNWGFGVGLGIFGDFGQFDLGWAICLALTSLPPSSFAICSPTTFGDRKTRFSVSYFFSGSSNFTAAGMNLSINFL